MRLPFDATDHHHRLAEVGLGVTGRVLERHEHLPVTPTVLPHVVLDDRVSAREPMLVTEPFEDPFGRVALLARTVPILGKPLIDDPGETIQLRPPNRRRPPVARRNRKQDHLVNAVA